MPAYYLEIAVVVIGLVVLLIESFAPRMGHKVPAMIGIFGLLAVFAALSFANGNPAAGESTSSFWSFYTADRLAFFYKGLALLSTVGMLFIALEYVPVLKNYTARGNGGVIPEYFCIPIFVCAGMMWMASANDLSSIFVSLELVTIAFYILVAYMRRNVGSLEAGVKYLILGALSTGFLVYGIAWLFGITGETNLDAIREAMLAGTIGTKPILFAFVLLIIGLGFKVGAVPLQIWVPDVYQGAPTPTTAFLAAGSKAGGFIILTRIVEPFLHVPDVQDKVVMLLAVIAGATLVYGSLAAIPQTNFKRLIAYSSIAHAGFILIAVTCVFPERFAMISGSVVAFYLGTYLPSVMACFLVLAIVRRDLGGEELDTLDGLGKRSPFLAFVLLVSIISMAGIPLTAGFFGKFFVFNLAVDQGHWVLLGLAVLAAACGFYYYFKVIRAMYWDAPSDDTNLQVSAMSRIVLILLVAAIIFFGLAPGGLLNKLPRPVLADVAPAVVAPAQAGH